jgi:hypothetical protein
MKSQAPISSALTLENSSCTTTRHWGYNAKTIMHQVCGYSQGGPFFIHVYLYCRRYAQLNTPPDHYFVTEIFDTKNQLNPLVARTIYRVGRVNCFIVLRRISSGIRSIFFRYYI